MYSRQTTACAVRGCNTIDSQQHLRLFKIPIDQPRRNEWLNQIQRQDLMSNLDSQLMVCENHFEKSVLLAGTPASFIPALQLPGKEIPGAGYCPESVQHPTSTLKRKLSEFHDCDDMNRNSGSVTDLPENDEGIVEKVGSLTVMTDAERERTTKSSRDSISDKGNATHHKSSIFKMPVKGVQASRFETDPGTVSGLVKASCSNVGVLSIKDERSTSPPFTEEQIVKVESITEDPLYMESENLVPYVEMKGNDQRDIGKSKILTEKNDKSSDNTSESDSEDDNQPLISKRKITSVNNLLSILKSKGYISTDEFFLLDFMNLEITDLAKDTRNKDSEDYTSDLRSFALTLFFYSNSGYDFVRKHFHTKLPPTTTIRQWLVKPGGNPGFTKETIAAMKQKIKQSDKAVKCALLVKEIPVVGKERYVDGEGYYGFVDVGTELDTDCNERASSALVFIVAALNASWKVPIGYFMIRAISHDQRANLVNLAIHYIEKAGADLCVLSCDMSHENKQMLLKLGCSFQANNLITKFTTKMNTVIHVFPDPTDILERIRLDLDVCREYKDGNGNLITLAHIESLLLKYDDAKRNNEYVEIPKQFFYREIATALWTFKENLDLTGDIDGTASFINRINDVFDILTCQKNASGLKGAITDFNMNDCLDILDSALNYFGKMKKSVKIKVKYDTLGIDYFRAAIITAKDLIKTLMESEDMDNIEFGKLSLKSCNFLFKRYVDDPTAYKIIKAYRTSLKYIEESDDKIPIENMTLLNCDFPIDKINLSTVLPNNREEFKISDDLSTVLLSNKYLEFREFEKDYIASYIIKLFNCKLHCDICLSALTKDCFARRIFTKTLKQNKTATVGNRFGRTITFCKKVLNPADDIITICKMSEKVVKEAINCSMKGSEKVIKARILIMIMEKIQDKEFFTNIKYHQFDMGPMDNHILELCKAIAYLYVETRFKYKAYKSPSFLWFDRFQRGFCL